MSSAEVVDITFSNNQVFSDFFKGCQQRGQIDCRASSFQSLGATTEKDQFPIFSLWTSQGISFLGSPAWDVEKKVTSSNTIVQLDQQFPTFVNF